MTRVYLSLGSNLGERRKNLRLALLEISRLPGTRVIKSSSIYKTDPVLPSGSSLQPKYFNQAVEIETRLAPPALLDRLLEIEKTLGRVRGRKNASRTIDIDIVYYGRKILAQKGLAIPHPRAAERRFVLRPLCELDPRLLDPVHKKTVAELLKSVPADQKIHKLPGPLRVQSKK
ncbi:MAG: 2-amino-4-hydroxy-6-hydroxymethyldihydropteridine diphosphokinase [bacterium]|nr:2-amino-4-hydroxy-6-hydroxymethyldihydropteridine diphosphokinase [bacterium]